MKRRHLLSLSSQRPLGRDNFLYFFIFFHLALHINIYKITCFLRFDIYHLVRQHVALVSVDAEGERHTFLRDACPAMRQAHHLHCWMLIRLFVVSVEVSFGWTNQSYSSLNAALTREQCLIYGIRNLNFNFHFLVEIVRRRSDSLAIYSRTSSSPQLCFIFRF